MNDNKEKVVFNEFSHLIILLSYTFFSLLVTVEVFVMEWEKWALILLVFAVVTSWMIHIRRLTVPVQRLWIYSVFMMLTFFFYGVHLDATFDLAIIIVTFMLLYTLTGLKKLITFCQVTYYFTLTYCVVMLLLEQKNLEFSIITRSVLHIVTVTMIAWLSKKIILPCKCIP